MTRARRGLGALALPAFFAIKILSGLILLKLSSAKLDVAGFAIFSQFFLLSALVNMVAVGGAQNGLIRQVAAARESEEAARARDAAFLLWIGAALVVGVPLAIASPWVADLLAGAPALWWMVVAIAALSLIAGPGQIWCALLTGRGRPAASLSAQAIGLVAGTGSAAWMLMQGNALPAVLAFAAGPIVTMAIAGVSQRSESLGSMALRRARPDARALLHFSGAFLTVASFTAITLFLLRGVYQDVFGLERLGYWLTANRISDTTTQFLALYLLQYFLPGYTAAIVTDEARARRTLLRSWGFGVAAMAGFPIVFAIAPAAFVRLFLSPQFYPAIPAILAYMTGDVLRVWAATAMQAAFARGRLLGFILIETGTIVLMGAIMLALVAVGNADAPIIAYPVAYGVTALIASLVYLRGVSRAARDRAPAAPPS